MNNFEQAKKFITDKNRFLMASHARTDGDDGGSMLAMSIILEPMNKQATLVADGGVPSGLQFLPRQNLILSELPNPVTNEFYDGVILFGCGKKTRAGFDAIINSTLPILNIDHHPDNQMYGTVNLVDAQKSSVAELVYDFFKYLDIKFNSDIAKCLLTGMFTDTGAFMHSNTQPSTLIAAGELMKYGARIDKIYESTYQSKDLNSLKAWAKAIENTRLLNDDKVAISVVTQEDLDQLGEVSNDTFEGFVETLNKIPGIKFALFLRQDGNQVKGSLRSEENKNMDVSFLANLFGGGGHKLASGFEIPGKIIKQEDGSWKIDEK